MISNQEAAPSPRRHPLDCRPFTAEEVIQSRYWAKVDKEGPIPAWKPELGPCWLWAGAKNARGYGSLSVNGRLILAHRIAVVLDGREIPHGLTIDHSCRVTSCVNPRHLEVVTGKRNAELRPESLSLFCKRGHEYAGNMFVKNGSRQCRTCWRMTQARYRERVREARRPTPIPNPSEEVAA